jgi:hypothetical protein
VRVTALLEPLVEPGGEAAAMADPGASGGQEVRVTVSGTTFRFASAMGPMLHALARARAVSVADLRAASHLDPSTFDRALELLLQQHLAVLDP